MYEWSKTCHRTLPTATNDVTHETIHPSVLQQKSLLSSISDDLKKNPSLVCSLMALEDHVKSRWDFPRAGKTDASAPAATNTHQKRLSVEASTEVVKKMKVFAHDSDGTSTGGMVYKEKIQKTSVAQVPAS